MNASLKLDRYQRRLMRLAMVVLIPPATHWLTIFHSVLNFLSFNVQAFSPEPATEVQGSAHPLRDIVVLVVRIVFFLIIIAIILLYNYFYKTKPPTEPSMCRSKSCSEWSTLLNEKLNRDVNPCEDFENFVCSRSHIHQETFPQNRLRLQFAWAERRAGSFRKRTFTLNATRKAAAMFTSCIDANRKDINESVSVLKSFLGERRLPWPNKPPPSLEPFDVLLDLAINWELPLWFQIQLMRTDRDHRQVMITPLAQSLLYFPDMSSSISRVVYRRYWMQYFNLLSDDPCDAASKSRATKSWSLHNDITRILKFRTSRTYDPQIVRLGDVGPNVPSLATSMLVTMFNKYYRVVPKWNERDELIASDGDILHKLLEIFARYEKTDLLDLLGWWLVQLSGVTMATGAPGQSLGRVEPSPSFLTLFCVVQVEDVYKLALACDDTFTQFTAKERNDLDAFFNSILYTATNLLNHTTVLSVKRKREAIDKLTTIAIHIWPNKSDVCGDTRILDLYSKFPANEELFINYWIRARGSASELGRSTIHLDLERIPHFFYDRPLYYDPILNIVRISMSSLVGPLYYNDGTKSMDYGGLGGTFTVEIARVFDSITEQLRESVENGTISAASKNSCGNNIDSFRQSVALQLAYCAYGRDQSANKNLRLEHLPDFSGEQLFFIAWCYVACVYRASEVSHDDCTKIAGSFKGFAYEFNCPTDTNEKRSEKCEPFH